MDVNDRVYATDLVTGEEIGDEAPCMWFAACENPANGLREGPIGDGQYGPIPICKRCNDRLERLMS